MAAEFHSFRLHSNLSVHCSASQCTALQRLSVHAPLTTGYRGLKECMLQMPNPPVISTCMNP